MLNRLSILVMVGAAVVGGLWCATRPLALWFAGEALHRHELVFVVVGLGAGGAGILSLFVTHVERLVLLFLALVGLTWGWSYAAGLHYRALSLEPASEVLGPVRPYPGMQPIMNGPVLRHIIERTPQQPEQHWLDIVHEPPFATHDWA